MTPHTQLTPAADATLAKPRPAAAAKVTAPSAATTAWVTAPTVTTRWRGAAALAVVAALSIHLPGCSSSGGDGKGPEDRESPPTCVNADGCPPPGEVTHQPDPECGEAPSPQDCGEDCATASAVALGDEHTCSLTAGGAVLCWGDNKYGQVGDGTHGSAGPSRPQPVTALRETVMGVVAGGAHGCALSDGGALTCWGDNAFGQVGSGSDLEVEPQPVPVRDLPDTVRQVDAGAMHTCALLANGDVRCWGDNAYGQLGSHEGDRSDVPVAVTPMATDVRQLVAGGEFNCVVTAAGGASCWGDDTFGQLGDPGTRDQQQVPAPVAGLDCRVNALAAGGDHACAVLDDGTVRCWGDNTFGQLGDGGQVDESQTPVRVLGLPEAVQELAAGWYHTCALTVSGTLYCWGKDDAGQLGDNSALEHQTRAVAVSQLGGTVAHVSAGGSHTCALLADGSLRCWGDDRSGQLGDGGANESKATPVDVALPDVN